MAALLHLKKTFQASSSSSVPCRGVPCHAKDPLYHALTENCWVPSESSLSDSSECWSTGLFILYGQSSGCYIQLSPSSECREWCCQWRRYLSSRWKRAPLWCWSSWVAGLGDVSVYGSTWEDKHFCSPNCVQHTLSFLAIYPNTSTIFLFTLSSSGK